MTHMIVVVENYNGDFIDVLDVGNCDSPQMALGLAYDHIVAENASDPGVLDYTKNLDTKKVEKPVDPKFRLSICGKRIVNVGPDTTSGLVVVTFENGYTEEIWKSDIEIELV